MTGLISTSLLAVVFSFPALATEPPAPGPTPTPVHVDNATPAPATPEATSEAAIATNQSLLQVSPELSLALEVVEGPVRNDRDGTYSVTYELVVTQAGNDTIEPLSLLGFTTTGEIVSSETALEPTPDPATPIPEVKVQSGLGVAKRLVRQPSISDGAFAFTYEITLSNTGDDALSKIRLVDRLADVFGADATIDIVAVTSDGEIKVNSSFDGRDDVDLVAPGATLAAGKRARLLVTVAVVPSALGQYETNVAASGVSESGASLIDLSADGVEVDADGDGDPSNDNEPTMVNLTSEQGLDVSLQVVGTATETSTGVFVGKLALTVENPGPFGVENLQIYELFGATNGSKLLVESATSDTLSLNPWFDGQTDLEVLSGDDSLAVGASGVVVIELMTTVEDLQTVPHIAGVQATDPFGTVIKAGADDVLAAVRVARPKSDAESDVEVDDEVASDEEASDGIASDVVVTASPMPVTGPLTKNEPVASPRIVEAGAGPDTRPGEVLGTSSAALEPDAVSGALRMQYQVAIAGLVALVLALVGGGTAAGINRRERNRSTQVTEWLRSN